MSDIHFIQAGGTIDKDYLGNDENHGYNFMIGRPGCQSVLQRAGIPYEISFTRACQKDSLDMDDSDRNRVRDIVLACREERIIITHGTDTIKKTATTLSSIKNKVIVLTGAMKPEKFRDTDADFNIGMAVGAVHCLPNGVYIALYGEVKPWEEYVPR